VHCQLLGRKGGVYDIENAKVLFPFPLSPFRATVVFGQGALLMKHFVCAALLLAALPSSTLVISSAQQNDQVAKVSLKVGDIAPDFTLLSDGYWENGKWIDKWKNVKLSDFHGKKNVFLAVYVLAFTGG
jgi:hypothetical protein